MSQCTSHRRNTVQGTLPCPWCELETARATLAAVTAELAKVREDWIRAEDMWRERQDHLLAAVTAERDALKAERDELARRLKVAMSALGGTVRYWPADVAARVLDAIEGTSK